MSNPVNTFVNALDNYRDARDSWCNDVSRSGFYDPCGYAEKHAKEKIAEAEEAFLLAFKTLVGIVNE